MTDTMRAHVVRAPGGPEVLETTDWPAPERRDGWVLIGIEAFGLNRAEAVTRAGGSGDAVPFPKVIGIEAVGRVLDAGGTDLAVGQTVATAMGGLGRAHDGSYAERTLARRTNVFPLDTALDWTTLAAIPETFLTAWGCLDKADALSGRPRVVVRPGASALGLAIAQIVGNLGGETIGVTRSAHKRDRLLDGGMTEVLVADGPVADEVARRWPDGPTAVVDTVAGDVTIADALTMLDGRGRLIVAGSLADSYGTGPAGAVGQAMARDDVDFFSSEELDTTRDTPILQAVVDKVAAGSYRAGIDTVYPFDAIVEAHQAMEANAFAGKVVVTVTG